MSEDAKQVPCPFCKELIIEGAKKCRHCGEMLDAKPVKTSRLAQVDAAVDKAMKPFNIMDNIVTGCSLVLLIIGGIIYLIYKFAF